jgi:HEPN domain-containing protein
METGEPTEWLRHAESDLTYAKLGQGQQAILRNQVAFHAEQGADWQTLLLLLRNNRVSVPPEIEQASALMRFAVEARYPGDIEPITPEEVALAIEMAERAVAWARVQICEVPGPVNAGPIAAVPSLVTKSFLAIIQCRQQQMQQQKTR